MGIDGSIKNLYHPWNLSNEQNVLYKWKKILKVSKKKNGSFKKRKVFLGKKMVLLWQSPFLKECRMVCFSDGVYGWGWLRRMAMSVLAWVGFAVLLGKFSHSGFVLRWFHLCLSRSVSLCFTLFFV